MPRHGQLRTVGIILSLLFAFGVVIGSADAAATLRIGTAIEPPTLDPQRDAGGPASNVQQSVFETLVTFDQEMNLQPLLAERWDVSDDGKTYTFYLRPGVTFHDGTPLTADAVKFTFDRALGKLGGGQSRYVTLMSQLDSVEVHDESTVVFHLKEPYAPFLNNLAHLGYSILSPAAFDAQGESGFGRSPVGTGPFMVENWRSGREITLVKNPNYWQEGLPALDRAVLQFIPDASTRIIALQSGDIDIALNIPESDFPWLSNTRGIKTYQANTLRTVFLMFNPTRKPFDDKAVRQAFVESIDREGIAAAILEGLHRPAVQPTFAPDVWGVGEGAAPYRFDPDHAARVLDEAGWTRGSSGLREKDGQPLAFTLYVTQDRYPKDTEIGEYLRAALSQSMGARVELGTFEWQTYRQNIFAKELDVFLFGAGVSTGDLDYVITILFHSGSNYNQAPTPVEDEIIQAQVTVDPEERLALYQHIQQVIADEFLWVPLYWQSELHASSDRVENFAPHPMEKVIIANVRKR